MLIVDSVGTIWHKNGVRVVIEWTAYRFWLMKWCYSVFVTPILKSPQKCVGLFSILCGVGVSCVFHKSCPAVCPPLGIE